jgi:hypothetical protein
MRPSAAALIRATMVCSLPAWISLPNAAATTVNISFSGTVNPPSAGITLPANVETGDSLSGSLSYNPSQTGSKGVYSFTGPIQTFLYSIMTPGFNPALFSDQYKGSPAAFTITITDTTSGGATLDVHCLTVGGSESSKAGGGTVDLLFTATTYSGLALPQNQAAFDNAFATSKDPRPTLTWDPDGIGFTATISLVDGFFFSIPEPSTLAMGIIALALCSARFAIVRRKAAGSSQPNAA